MKNSFKLFSILAVALLLVVSACKKDDDDNNDPVNENPVLNFLVEQGYVNGDVTLAPGNAFKTKIYMAENATTKKNIDFLNVRRIKNNTTVYDTAYNIGKSEETLELNFNAQLDEGTETFEFEAVDNGGKKVTIRFIVTTVGPGTPVNTYAGVILGSWNDQTYGSFFSTSTNQVFFKPEVQANLALIDFAFSLGTTSGSIITSVSDSALMNEFFSQTWSGANITKFEYPAPIDAPTFDAIGNFFQFPAFSGTAIHVNQLKADDVIYFETAAGKYGFIKINQINDKGDIINIDVKVEN